MARGRSVAAALIQAAILVGCSGAPAVSPSPALTASPTLTPSPAVTQVPTNTPTPTVGPEGRIFSFDDGALTIIAPAGAVPEDIELVATARGPEDRPPELADIQMSGTFYRLEPDGMTFPEPVTIIRRVALADLGLDTPGAQLPIITLALRTSNGGWTWLANQSFLSDGEYLYLSGEATHTSMVLGFGGTNYANSGWDGVTPNGEDGSFGAPVGEPFALHTSVSVPLDAPAPPEISELDNDAVFDLFQADFGTGGAYQDMYPEPFTHTGVLARGVQVTNTPGWSDLDPEQRADAFPGADFDFTCNQVGQYYTVVGYEVGGLGAGSPLWDRLNLDAPSTTAMIPLSVSCSEPLPGVEVGAVCVITVHTALGTYVSYLRGLVELIERLGWPVSGLEVTLSGANDGEPARAERRAGNVWEFTSGLHNAGAKKVEKVVVRFSNGVTRDITEQVIESLGVDIIDVPFPGEPTVGTCP